MSEKEPDKTMSDPEAPATKLDNCSFAGEKHEETAKERSDRKRITRTEGCIQLFKMLFLPCLPIVALIVQDCVTMYDVTEAKKNLYGDMNQVKLSVKYGKLLAALQAERSEIAYAVFNNGSVIRQNLTERFATTDDALDTLDKWPKFQIPTKSKLFNSRLRFRIGLDDFRKQLVTFIGDVESSDVAIISVVKWYNYANQGLLDQLDLLIKGNSGSGVWRLMITYKDLVRALENLGISLVYGLVYYGRGVLSHSTFTEYVRYTSLGEGYLNASANFAQFARGSFENVTGNYAGYEQLRRSRYAIFANRPINASMDKADAYYLSMESYMDKLRTIQVNLRNIIIKEIEKIVRSADQQMTVAITVLVVVTAVAPILVLVMYRASRTTQSFATELVRNSEQLTREMDRKSNLLCKPLSAKVDKALLSATDFCAAETFESMSICWCDIVAFTKLCSDSTATEMLTMVNSLHRLIDMNLKLHEILKLQTVGDSYIFSSKLHRREGKRHAEEISNFALDLLAGLHKYRIPHRSNQQPKIRMAIHSGNCVAGVVGVKNRRYCIFGDIVRVAQELATSCEEQEIHVSAATKAYLDEAGGFQLEIAKEGPSGETSYYLTGNKEMDNYPQVDVRKCFKPGVPYEHILKNMMTN